MFEIAEDLLRKRIYVSDDGKISCNDRDCPCEGDFLFDKRRMDLEDYVTQLMSHWR